MESTGPRELKETGRECRSRGTIGKSLTKIGGGWKKAGRNKTHLHLGLDVINDVNNEDTPPRLQGSVDRNLKECRWARDEDIMKLQLKQFEGRTE